MDRSACFILKYVRSALIPLPHLCRGLYVKLVNGALCLFRLPSVIVVDFLLKEKYIRHSNARIVTMSDYSLFHQGPHALPIH